MRLHWAVGTSGSPSRLDPAGWPGLVIPSTLAGRKVAYDNSRTFIQKLAQEAYQALWIVQNIAVCWALEISARACCEAAKALKADARACSAGLADQACSEAAKAHKIAAQACSGATEAPQNRSASLLQGYSGAENRWSSITAQSHCLKMLVSVTLCSVLPCYCFTCLRAWICTGSH